MDVISRFNVEVSGPADGQPMVFAPGFGRDQHRWRLVAPASEDRFAELVMVEPSQRYVDEGSYVGGPAATTPARSAFVRGASVATG